MVNITTYMQAINWESLLPRYSGVFLGQEVLISIQCRDSQPDCFYSWLLPSEALYIDLI